MSRLKKMPKLLSAFTNKTHFICIFVIENATNIFQSKAFGEEKYFF